MIFIELDICGTEYPFYYEMGAGEIENLYRICDLEFVTVNEWLEYPSVTECITDHFDNLKLSEDS